MTDAFLLRISFLLSYYLNFPSDITQAVLSGAMVLGSLAWTLYTAWVGSKKTWQFLALCAVGTGAAWVAWQKSRRINRMGRKLALEMLSRHPEPHNVVWSMQSHYVAPDQNGVST